MTDVIAPETSDFSKRTVLVMVLVGVLAAVGFGVLSTFAPDLRGGADGGAHALSKSAVGYAALARLLREEGVPVVISRGALPGNSDGRGLLIVTPDGQAKIADIEQLVAGRRALVVASKWSVADDTRRKGWVRRAGFEPSLVSVAKLLPRGERFRVEWRSDRAARPVLTGAEHPFPPGLSLPIGPVRRFVTAPQGFVPVLVDETSRGVLARVKGRSTYILTDADILNNHGLASLDNARATMAIVDGLREGGPVVFDVTLNGFKRSRSLWKLALEPPFLAATLCALAAAALMGAHAAARFGPVRRPERSIALGKAALADNAAALIALAGREPNMAARYAALTRRAIAHAVGLKPDMAPEQTDAALDRLRADRGAFSEQVVAADRANDATTLMAAARRLHETRMEMTRERR